MVFGLTRLGVLLCAACIAVNAAYVMAASAQYPNKPIRMLAPEPGGGNEIAGRTIAQAIAEGLGQNVVIENRGGASGVIAGEIVARAAPDGYTVLYYGSTIWLLPYLRHHVPFDAVKDFAPISLVTRAPFFLFMNPAVQVSNVKELIALAKANPGKLNYGSAGSGAATHLSAELFKIAAGVNLTRIAYKGASVATTALVSGEVHVMFVSGVVGFPHVKAGRLKVLAVASAQPSPLAPDVPTMAAAGLPGYEAASISGMFAPAKTPLAIVNLLNDKIMQALKRDDVRLRFMQAGSDAVGSTPTEFSAIIRADRAKWSKVIQEAGIHEEKGR